MQLRSPFYLEMQIKMEQQVLRILDNAQQGPVNHMRNFLKLQNVYKLSDINRFSTFFVKMLKKLVQQDYNNQNVKNILDFMGHFVGRIATQENDPEHSFEHPVLQATIDGLSEEFINRTENGLLNICLFFSFILKNIGDDVIVNNYLGDIVQNTLLKSLKDLQPAVRVQGIIALTRLQNPVDDDCPVIREFIRCLGDSSYMVRQEAVKRLAPNRCTINAATIAIRDCNPKVRFAAFSHLGDIGLKYLKIVQRQHVLQSGFSETHVYPKRVFLDYVLPKWLSSLGGSFLKFLQVIKLDADEYDIEHTEYLSQKLMQEFVKSQPIENLVKELPLNEYKLIAANEIESEHAVYWNTLYHYLHEVKSSDDILETLVPELKVFSDYIEKLIELKYSKKMENWELLDLHHLLYQLFAITDHMNFQEEVGRRTLDILIKKLLKKYEFQPRLLTKLFSIAMKLNFHRTNDFIDETCAIIKDIWQPLTSIAATDRQQIDKCCKMAEITVKINVLEHDKEQAIDEKDFLKAQMISVALEQKKLELQQLTMEKQATEKSRITKNDPATLCRCLDLFIALLLQVTDKTMPLSLIDLRDNFLIPLVANRNIDICWRAFRALTIFCIIDEDLARENLQALTAPVTFYRTNNLNVNMLVDSISVITDLIRLHGTIFFSNEFETENPASRTLYVEDANLDRINEFTIDGFITLLLDLLDVENDNLRENAVTALCKLIMNDFPVNFTLITRLVLKWYSKITQPMLQQVIGLLLKTYSDKNAAAKENIAKAVVPILTQLADAPRSSPLASVKIENVISFLAALTHQETGVVHVHTELARMLLNELTTRETAVVSIYYVKMLMQLRLTSVSSPAFKELLVKTESFLASEDKHPKDQVIRAKLRSFLAKLRNDLNTSLASQRPQTEEQFRDQNIDPQNNIETEQVQSRRRRISTLLEASTSKENNSESSVVHSEAEEVSYLKKRRVKGAVHTETQQLESENNQTTNAATATQLSSSSSSDVNLPAHLATQFVRRTSERVNSKRVVNDGNSNVTNLDLRFDPSTSTTSDSQNSLPRVCRRRSARLRRSRINDLSGFSSHRNSSTTGSSDSSRAKPTTDVETSGSPYTERKNIKRRRLELEKTDCTTAARGRKTKSDRITKPKELHIKITKMDMQDQRRNHVTPPRTRSTRLLQK